LYAAILAGGSGRRFWPASTLGRPKQFLDITGRGTMLSLTRRRLSGILPPERILVLTALDHALMVRKELPDIPEENIFAEPVSRNTAPSLAVAAAMVLEKGGDEPLLCCPSDHLITGDGSFEGAVETAARAASSRDVLVTFGIRPSHPATGYGYIETGGRLEEGVLEAASFREKPDRSTAMSFLESGRHYWNSGIFMWRPTVFLDAWDRFLPAGREPIGRIMEACRDGEALDPVASGCYSDMPSVSVDYGILERASNVVVVPADFGWSDVGSWDALEGIVPSDGSGNSVVGDSTAIDSKGNIFYNPEGFTAAIGVEGIIVAVSGGSVLVCRKGESQKVRDLLDRMEEENRDGLL